jgi:hypothetical protein
LFYLFTLFLLVLIYLSRAELAALQESSGSHASRRPVLEGDVFRTTLDEVLKVEQTRQNNTSKGEETPQPSLPSLPPPL